MGYIPWGRKESETTERLQFRFPLLFIPCKALDLQSLGAVISLRRRSEMASEEPQRSECLKPVPLRRACLLPAPLRTNVRESL